MGSRQTIHVRKRLDIEEIPAPNRVIPQVQVEIRISFPRNTTREQMFDLLSRAALATHVEIEMHEPWVLPEGKTDEVGIRIE